MCRLFGIIANKPVDLRFSLSEGPGTLQDLGASNPDGWGVGWYEERLPEVFKESISVQNSNQLPRLAREVRSKIAICHVRRATTGACSRKNCHPFAYKRWLFAHNGSVARGNLYRLLEEERRRLLEGETDSEVYFHWLLQCMDDRENPIDAIRRALAEAANHHHTGMNFVLSDGRKLYACRYASSNYGYYSLFYLKRTPSKNGPWCARSAEVRALLESKSLAGEQALLICSEPLTEESWTEIPPAQILVVNEQLETKLYDVR